MTREEAIAYGKRAIGLGLNDETQAFCELAIKTLEQKPCEDAVSRASVFEIMGNLLSIPYDFDRNITEKDVSESMDKIRELPRVTPQEPKWIPVTERLPEVETDVLICYSNTISVGYWYVDTATYDFEFRDLCETGWYYSQDDEFKSCDPYDVIAWMPLPQPYKAKSEVKE